MYGVYENERKRLKRNAEFRVILWHIMTFKIRHLPIHNSIYQITYLKFNQKYLKKKHVYKNSVYVLLRNKYKKVRELAFICPKKDIKTLICRKAYAERSFSCS